MSKPSLLTIGFARPGFGFGRVLGSLHRRLYNRYDLHHFELSRDRAASVPWDVTYNGVPGDRAGLLQLPELIRKLRPSVVFILADIWLIPPYVRAIRTAVERTRLVAYCPIDGEIIAHDDLTDLAGLSRVVLYTEFGRSEVHRVVADLEHRGMLSGPVRTEVIPHGVDARVFHPSRTTERTARVQSRVGDAGFVALNANRNQPRKRLDLTVSGFATFAADKPSNVKLHLHAGVRDDGVNLLGLANFHGVRERVVLTRRENRHPHVPDAELNEIYNACDVGINTSSGEGWGLISFEHAATVAAQIVPRHTACAELWEGCASFVEPVRTAQEPYSRMMTHEVSPESLAVELEALYQDRDLLASMSAAAFDNAMRPELRWDAVADQFDDLFRVVLDEQPERP